MRVKFYFYCQVYSFGSMFVFVFTVFCVFCVGIANRVLSAKCLLPYSRMTYTAYLLNPLIIMSVVMLSEAPVHLDFLSMVSRTEENSSGTWFLSN